jgi:hypothetical protein
MKSKVVLEQYLNGILNFEAARSVLMQEADRDAEHILHMIELDHAARTSLKNIPIPPGAADCLYEVIISPDLWGNVKQVRASSSRVSGILSVRYDVVGHLKEEPRIRKKKSGRRKKAH